MRRQRLAGALLLVVLAAAGCGATTPTEPDVAVVPDGGSPASVAGGAWGGVGAALEVGASEARLELDCAHATFAAPISLDAQGEFRISVGMVFEGGPEREGETRPATPVVLAGKLVSGKLGLAVVDPSSGNVLSAVDLKLGATPVLRKCG